MVKSDRGLPIRIRPEGVPVGDIDPGRKQQIRQPQSETDQRLFEFSVSIVSVIGDVRRDMAGMLDQARGPQLHRDDRRPRSPRATAGKRDATKRGDERDHVEAAEQDGVEGHREVERRQPRGATTGIGGIDVKYSAARTGTLIIMPTSSETMMPLVP